MTFSKGSFDAFSPLSEKSTRNDPAFSSPAPSSLCPPLIFSRLISPVPPRVVSFLFSLLPLPPPLVTPIRIFSISASLSRKMSPSLSEMSARVQVEFCAAPRAMSLPLEMFDNIGHQRSPMEHEVDNSYKLSRIEGGSTWIIRFE